MILRVDKLDFRIQNKEILKNISFEIEDKNILILGANGAGKSTLATLLSGIKESKNIFIDGECISKLLPQKRAKLINYVPPTLEIFDEFMSAKEFLELNYILSLSDSVAEIKKRELEIVEILNLEDILQKSAKSLSSGQKQLLNIASAYIQNSHFCIFDEPTSNLDAEHRRVVFELLKDNSCFKNRIIITHDLNFAYKLGFDVLYLSGKEIGFFGENKLFFDEVNIEKFFGNNLKKISGYIVDDL